MPLSVDVNTSDSDICNEVGREAMADDATSEQKAGDQDESQGQLEEGSG